MNRQAQAVVLLLVGGAILRASFTDLYLRYVKEGLQPFLIASGILLVAAAVATLWFELRGNATHNVTHKATHEATHEAGHDDHGHSHREPAVAWLLVLPVFALLLVAPPALGSYAANRAGTALQETSDFPPLPAGDPVKVGLVDYATRAVYDEGKSLDGRRVQLTGFVMIGPDGAPYLARMTLSCCAADARPVKVGLDGSVPDGVAADNWLEVVGKYTTRSTKDDVNGGVIPYLDVEESRRIDAPTNQYEG